MCTQVFIFLCLFQKYLFFCCCSVWAVKLQPKKIIQKGVFASKFSLFCQFCAMIGIDNKHVEIETIKNKVSEIFQGMYPQHNVLIIHKIKNNSGMTVNVDEADISLNRHNCSFLSYPHNLTSCFQSVWFFLLRLSPLLSSLSSKA